MFKEKIIYLRLLLNYIPKTLDSRLESEKYKIISKGEVKCWVYLNIEDGGHFQLHRADINPKLVDLVIGHEIEVIKKSDPHGTVYIAAIIYDKEFLYPRKTKIETERFYRTGLI